ncbi:MAG: GNAT family N-acetyltransferase [Ferruginibacter sp.]
MNNIEWRYKTFGELSAIELYKILKIRSEVFVVEQNCVYLDADGKDQLAFHLTGWLQSEAVAYVRILPPGLAYDEAAIGRVLTSKNQRRYGTGRVLMEKAIDFTLKQFNTGAIRIGAQVYLEKFYTSLGFNKASDEYLEDGIPHIEMLFTK